MALSDNQAEILDVAVVGGGVSGLYSAWRLRTESSGASGGAPNVTLFECSDRLGGRLLSVIPPGIPDTRVELGGMRYTSTHARVSGLVKLFGLKADDFPVSEPQNIVHVRGQTLRAQDLSDAEKIPYWLAPDESGPTALNLGMTALGAQRALRIVYGKDVPLDKVDWNDFAVNGRYHGKALWQLSLQYVLSRSISEEAFKFAEDTSGYDSILHTWNAAAGLPWNVSDFGVPPKFFHLHDGFEALPSTIAQKYAAAGGSTHLHHRLINFDRTALPDGSAGVKLQVSLPDGGERTVLTRRLILAMPRRALELLEPTGDVLDPSNKHVRGLMESVQPIPLFKLALCYSYAWWETLEPAPVPQSGGGSKAEIITCGRSVTDLPVRQCYYWAKNPQTQTAVVLIYDDGSDLEYWAGLRDRPKAELYAHGVEADGDAGLSSWRSHQAPRLMVEEAHRQLLVMHGAQDRADIPWPFAAAYRDWGEDPFGGGANFWRVGAESRRVFKDILQPQPDCPVYICGEAYSHDQGWVEGALATADAMLEQHFGLKPPPWMR
jgi:hypothetical protein